jgi:hypothetical protein
MRLALIEAEGRLQREIISSKNEVKLELALTPAKIQKCLLAFLIGIFVAIGTVGALINEVL